MSADRQDLIPTDLPSTTSTTAPKAKSTRKGKPKATSTLKANGKRSINLSMPVEDYERFLIHAMRLTGGNISELVCQLGREHLREYHLTRTATRNEAGQGA